jgi:hypothetical protein
VLVGFSIGLVRIADPWMIWIYDSLEPSERMSMLDSVGATAFLALIASIGVLFLRLRIDVWPNGTIRVVNPIATWWFTSDQITKVIDGPFPSVRLLDGRHIWLMGAEQSLAMNLMNRQLKNIFLVQPNSSVSKQSDVSSGARRTYRGILWYALPWLAGIVICVAAILTGHA